LQLLLKLLIARGYSVGSLSAKLLSAPFLAVRATQFAAAVRTSLVLRHAHISLVARATRFRKNKFLLRSSGSHSRFM